MSEVAVAAQCANPRCDRELQPDGPSMYFCGYQCATGTTFAYRHHYEASQLYRGTQSDTGPDATSWSTRSATPSTKGANLDFAFPWLDVRAKG
jgi:hypothetical protein